jgi:iron(III) transport system ATP-binding protein
MIDVRVEHLDAGYGPVRVLHGLDLRVPAGTLTAVLGESGSGKTTLLRVLAGFLRPTAGVVAFGSHVVADSSTWVPPERRRVGIVPQEGALFPHLSVAGNVGFGLPRDSDQRIVEMLDLVGMAASLNARPHELSGGQQQRVALARALAPEPEVLLLDEPFAALDAGLRLRLRQEVRDIVAELGTTAIMVTHDQEEALSISDQVAVMRNGRIVQVDIPTAVYEHPVDLSTARFVGDVVELPATRSDDGFVESAVGKVRLADADTDGDGVLVLRPEQLVIVDERSIGPEQKGALGTVRNSTYHGHDSMFLIRLDDGADIAVRVPGGGPVQPGDRVRVIVTGAGRLYADT